MQGEGRGQRRQAPGTTVLVLVALDSIYGRGFAEGGRGPVGEALAEVDGLDLGGEGGEFLPDGGFLFLGGGDVGECEWEGKRGEEAGYKCATQ